jgi:hypothetical protein
MAYFMINGKDFSGYVSAMRVKREAKYNAQTNAAGNTVVDYINSKREIEVEIIPLDSATMIRLQAELANFEVSISFRNPITGALEENVRCIIPDDEISYYTIQSHKVMFQAMGLTFSEL